MVWCILLAVVYLLCLNYMNLFDMYLYLWEIAIYSVLYNVTFKCWRFSKKVFGSKITGYVYLKADKLHTACGLRFSTLAYCWSLHIITHRKIRLWLFDTCKWMSQMFCLSLWEYGAIWSDECATSCHFDHLYIWICHCPFPWNRRKNLQVQIWLIIINKF